MKNRELVFLVKMDEGFAPKKQVAYNPMPYL